MARPKKSDKLDLSEAIELTAGAIERLTCRTDIKAQAFLRDSKAPGLRVRVTNTGAKSFVFEAKLNRDTIRRTIGDVRAWTIDAARIEANRLRVMIDAGIDPRELERQQQADKATAEAARASAQARQAQQEAAEALTVGEVWKDYLQQRRPFWGELHYRDHIIKASPGGELSKRRGMTNKLTKPGPLAALMRLPLKKLDQATIEAWAAHEGKTRPSSARLSWRLLTVFLTWCGEQPEYAPLLPAKNPAKTKKAREALGKAGTKSDALQKGQLSAWFSAIRQIGNPTTSNFLQVLLLTGARLNEMQALRWNDVDTHWKVLSIHDKVDGTRSIPLTPYVEALITALPKRSDYVFASARVLDMSAKNIERRQTKAAKRGTSAPAGPVMATSTTGYISEPNTVHTRACRAVGIEGLTLHGLRRSFKSLTEWLEVPVGVVAQIMGHKPSATAEKHYTVRPLDLLRVHHERIEAWILQQAGVTFDPATATASKLRAVKD